MPLEMILWAIPAASLAAAGGVIAFRVSRLRGDGIREAALLAEAMTGASSHSAGERKAAKVVEFHMPAARRPAPEFSPPAAVPSSKSRLQPIAIVICRPAEREAALAG